MQSKYEEASQVATDAVGSIRTVASFCAEEKVMEMYKRKCEGPLKSGIKQGLVSGTGFGVSFFLLFSVYATCFYAGAQLVQHGRTNFQDVFQVNFLFLIQPTLATLFRTELHCLTMIPHSPGFLCLDHGCYRHFTVELICP